MPYHVTIILCLMLAIPAISQTPEEYFRGAGAGFRGTSEEQQKFWTPHIETSHRQILGAAELAENREVAILLGPGVCSEIPLEELARRFERVILVDLDGHSMLAAVEALPMELRPKVELRISDVTTFASTLMSDLREAVEASQNADEAFHQFDTLFASLRTGVQKLWLPQADVVISSLLLSELPRYPLAYADRLVRARFDTRLREWKGRQVAREKLARLVTVDHVAVLHALRREGGVIYYGDTISRGPAYSQFPPARRTAVEGATLMSLHALGFEGASAAPILGRLCYGEFGFEREIAAFENLLEAYESAGRDSFESLVELELLQQEWKEYGLRPASPPISWWWIEYPCAVVHSPGAFRATGWILK